MSRFVGQLGKRLSHIEEAGFVDGIRGRLSKSDAFRGIPTVINGRKWRHTPLPGRSGKSASRYLVPVQIFLTKSAGMVSCAVAKLKFEVWCEEHGRSDLLRSAPTASLLTQRLKSVQGLEGLRPFRPHGKERQYVGLRLKTSDEKWEEIG